VTEVRSGSRQGYQEDGVVADGERELEEGVVISPHSQTLDVDDCCWVFVAREMPQSYGKERKKEEGFSLARCE
jgi:hypothetical protein